jgi:ribosomal protein L37AE/L43A
MLRIIGIIIGIVFVLIGLGYGLQVIFSRKSSIPICPICGKTMLITYSVDGVRAWYCPDCTKKGRVLTWEEFRKKRGGRL